MDATSNPPLRTMQDSDGKPFGRMGTGDGQHPRPNGSPGVITAMPSRAGPFPAHGRRPSSPATITSMTSAFPHSGVSPLIAGPRVTAVFSSATVGADSSGSSAAHSCAGRNVRSASRDRLELR